ncbi:MAG TPA: hypothetical protein DCZ95_11035 [Verrucomicrobia bacterium]|nr:MAG: hypothetical protein A2X46_07950 [Lentisphaerae bacterium GWF2_57_35]HBA84619.1 hypothetical protein [Verrucomicrobiota bacterium]
MSFSLFNKKRRAGRVAPVRTVMGLNAVFVVALAAMLVLMLNYLSFRHYRRFDWSRSRYYSLSEKSANLLSGLTNDVSVILLIQPGQDNYADIDNLLKEYAAASPRILLERVDPDRDIARTEELARKYKIDQVNVVVFDADGRSKYVQVDEVSDIDYAPLRYGQSPVKTAFRGEQVFSSAIQDITQGRRPVVYFLQGHGERDVENFDRVDGYSRLAQEIRGDNVEIRKLVLGEQKAVPDDCDALIVAGPAKMLAGSEIDLIRAYLQRKGRMMVLLDAMTQTGLEALLSEWRVQLGQDVVVDGARTLSGRELFVTAYGEHPIVQRLRHVTTVFYLPRSVAPAAETEESVNPADKPHAVALAASSDSGWAEMNMDQNPMKFDAETDQPGPVPVAVAVEKGPVPGFDVQIAPTRLVVFGDSDFISNGGWVGGNADLFMSSLNWLLQREQMMGIAPRPIEQSRLVMNDAQLQGLFWMVVAGIPAGVAFLGFLVWIQRRF